MSKHKYKIKIVKNGPYIVSGGVPVSEKIICETKKGVTYKEGRKLPQNETYSLCRCGKSKNAPFCDGAHTAAGFDGTETASKKPYLEGAKKIEGPDLILTDKESLCAFARFCHTEYGDAWDLTAFSNISKYKKQAIKAASECPAGRLVAWDKKTNQPIEPVYEPSVVVLQDPDKECSGPLWVRGGIPVESADGTEYEIRNRVTLCRCGRSRNKPFCDAAHVSTRFSDK